MEFSKNQTVSWQWGKDKAKGVITKIHTSDITKTIKGSEITRHASKEEPAYVIKQSDGDVVLKSSTEISAN